MADRDLQDNRDQDGQTEAGQTARGADMPTRSRAEQRRDEVVALCFWRTGPIYWFKSGGVKIRPGQFVVAQTERGPDVGQVVYVKDKAEPGHPAPTKSLLRKAESSDFRRKRWLQEQAREAIAVCRQKIAEHGLVMKLVRADYTLDQRQLIFFFTAEGRVDFRELVRDLAQTFHCHIELRQIGVRDEAKMHGGLGPCGQPLCCARFLREFKPVSIRLAKDQDLPLNPEKISGVCNRLMCCLRYEHGVYATARARLADVGEQVQTPHGEGQVVEQRVLKQELTVKLADQRIVVVSAADAHTVARQERRIDQDS